MVSQLLSTCFAWSDYICIYFCQSWSCPTWCKCSICCFLPA